MQWPKFSAFVGRILFFWLKLVSRALGHYPPAHCSVGNSNVEPLIVVHMLLSHVKAVKLYREHFQVTGQILNHYDTWFLPLGCNIVVNIALQYYMNKLSLSRAIDPLVFGDYPPEMRQYHGSALPRFSPEETEYVKGSIDFIGLNHYSTLYANYCIHSPCILGGDHFI
ncbi:beta-glucosidase 18-like [Durio zibethinus]|uniref:Beta-glucosidase 18-like n=1 Tax=Durio zibethinus TaxID=66656 RepID=A0A6P5Y561_DURZI|nr:beta-glucosidase 18-like [Durio zibethinus]